MQNKKILTVFVAALMVVGLSGCSLNAEVESLRPYSPSDGVQLDVEALKTRNIMFIRNESGNAVLIGSFVNSTMEEVMGSIQTTDADGNTVMFEFSVEPGGKFDLGYNGNPGLEVSVAEIAGGMRNVFIAAGGDPVGLLVPVMDGSLQEYRPFVEALD